MTQCSICLDDLNKRPISILQCSHEFHTHCVMPWLSAKGTCPICRAVKNISSAEMITKLNAEIEALHSKIETLYRVNMQLFNYTVAVMESYLDDN